MLQPYPKHHHKLFPEWIWNGLALLKGSFEKTVYVVPDFYKVTARQ